MRPILIVFVLAFPALAAGCLGGDEATDAPLPTAAASAEAAGAVAGPAPAAPKDAYVVASDDGASDAVVVYPMAITTNPAKAPVTLEFDGEFEAQDCTPMGSLPLGGLGLALSGTWNDFTDSIAVGDVFSYELKLTWTNTDQSWGDIHMFYNMGSTSGGDTDPTNDDRGEVTLNVSGQGLRASEDDVFGAAVVCWYGTITEPIPWKLTAWLTFAERAIPAQTPLLVPVPDGATKLFVSGVPLDPAQGVASHFRVFNPDDSLLCECALSSADSITSVDIPTPGDYVLLVDHTGNGFLSPGLDVTPVNPLVPLQTERVQYTLAAGDGGPIDVVAQIDLPTTPLALGAWVFAPGAFDGTPDVGTSSAFSMTIANARGEVLRYRFPGHVTYHAAVPGMFVTNDWYPLPVGDDFEFYQDHHAYDVGAHEAHVKADQFRGEARMFAVHYVRP